MKILLLLITSLLASSVHAMNVTNIRFSDDEKRTRIVFDLNSESDFNVSANDSFVLLNSPQLANISSSLFTNITTSRVSNIQLVDPQTLKINLTQNAEVGSFPLKASEQSGFRFVIDVKNDAKNNPQPMPVLEAPIEPESLQKMSANDAVVMFDKAVEVIRLKVINGEISLVNAADEISAKRKEIFEMIIEHNRRLLVFMTEKNQSEAQPIEEDLASKDIPLPPHHYDIPKVMSVAKSAPKLETTPNIQLVSQNTQSAEVPKAQVSDNPYQSLLDKRIRTIQNAWQRGKISDKQAAALIERQRNLLLPKIMKISV